MREGEPCAEDAATVARPIPRPLWRSFAGRPFSAAALHARGGGIAVLETRTWTLLARGGDGPADDLPLFSDWALRAVESPWWVYEDRGVAKGLVRAPIFADWRERVREWIDRDAGLDGATQPLVLDCLACAACCSAAEVVLDREDVARFAAAGRPDLARRTRRRGKKRLLPVVRETHACVHLDGPACTIYAMRPNMCREFPAGTENCLTAREEKLGRALP